MNYSAVIRRVEMSWMPLWMQNLYWGFWGFKCIANFGDLMVYYGFDFDFCKEED